MLLLGGLGSVHRAILSSDPLRLADGRRRRPAGAIGIAPPSSVLPKRHGERYVFRKMPSLPRMKISSAAPAIATMKRRMPPVGEMPGSPAIQKPSA